MTRTGSVSLPRSDWHALGVDEAAARLRTDTEEGLRPEEAQQRLAEHGPNRISEPERWVRLRRLGSQFRDALIWLLLAAALVSGLLLGSWIDAGAIAAIVVLNAAIGYAQETRADTALRGLRDLETPDATVIRDGEFVTIDAAGLVPGDLVVLEAGSRVPADGRVSSAIRMVADEAVLTGESVPVAKSPDPVPTPVALGDRVSMLFTGTSVVSGRGRMIITATGPDTEIGRMAALFSGERPSTPLQRELARVGRRLGFVALGAAALIFAAGLARSFPVEVMALTAVALAVAAIPEGLPAVVTVSLAGGLQRMARRNAIVRRLPAVETLGAVSVICTDKTGTLTANQLRVGEVALADGRNGMSVLTASDEAARLLVSAMALCNDARRSSDGLAGDPTEVALLRALEEHDVDFESLRAELPRDDEAGFDGRRKRMSTTHQGREGLVLFTKGAPEVVLDLCDAYFGGESPETLGSRERQEWGDRAEDMASRGLRTLAFAYKRLPDEPGDPIDEEHGLCLIGMVGLDERIRPGVPAAVETAARAGVTTVMVTGDHSTTARAVSERVGLEAGELMDGSRLSDIPDEELAEDISRYRVFARVDPADKVKIIEAWRRSGATVAMTGDGVNDAAALHRADIGVSMGSGTDVARESSAMVLADDDYSTIVTAIAEGRRIFDNLRNVVHYLLSANASEVLYVLAGFLLFGHLGEPLLAVQLLWINLMSDAMPAIALGMGTPARDLMAERPGQDRDVLSARNAALLLIQGVFLAAAALTAMVAGAFLLDLDQVAVRTMVFTTLVFSQLLHALSVRAGTGHLRRPSRLMLGSLVGAACLHLLVVYTPVGNQLLRTVPLTIEPLGWAIGTSILSMVLVRGLYVWMRRPGAAGLRT